MNPNQKALFVMSIGMVESDPECEMFVEGLRTALTQAVHEASAAALVAMAKEYCKVAEKP